MREKIKGSKIVLSEAPMGDVPAGILLKSPKLITKDCIGFICADAHKGQKEYNLPEKVARKDITGVYIRMM